MTRVWRFFASIIEISLIIKSLQKQIEKFFNVTLQFCHNMLKL